jgi:hypothetical protein
MAARGMTCPAEGCSTFLPDYGRCRGHWAEVHTSRAKLHQCMYQSPGRACRFAATRKNQVVRHFRQRHPAAKVDISAKVVANAIFQDPDRGLLPLQPVTEARQLYRERQAALRRSTGGIVGDILVREGTNPRDQEVRIEEDRCLVVTNRLWGPNSEKTVTEVEKI